MASRKDLVGSFQEEHPDTDLYLCFGPIQGSVDESVIEDFAKRRLSKHIVFWLVTNGGDPDVAYRIARCLQRAYGRLGTTTAQPSPDNSRNITIFVSGPCFSAGTLIALGATHLVMGDAGCLGPIDIQIRKLDDVFARDSVLTPTQALDMLERRSKSLFKTHFHQLRLDSSMGLTTKTAVEVASNIVSGLLAPIYGQIDPLRLGEMERMLTVTVAYGQRLAKHNLKSDDMLGRLVSGYPSHSFVIDRCEAEELFKNVSVPSKSLAALADFFKGLAQGRLYGEPLNLFLTAEPQSAKDTATGVGTDDQQAANGPNRGAATGSVGNDGSPRNQGEAGDNTADHGPARGASEQEGPQQAA